jgi:short subunit dehydrogenase-like uncharacterized protein
VSGDRDLDVVVFGATGFAGRLVAGYLAGHAPGSVRIGLAGRSGRRLADVRAQLGASASAWPLLVADSADPVSLAALARAARVVVTTVGPYRAQGLALVQACAEAGTDYADLTGEVLFIRDSIDRCHDVAAAAGARIVHCCGFDSIPSDLGVLGLHLAARADDAGHLQDTTLVVTALRGGVSGGTLASMMGQQAEVRASAQRRRVADDAYALSPDRAAEPDLGDERDLDWARYDGGLRMWTGPFAMAGINTRVVRRSNALQDWAYGRRFRYREVTGFGAGPAAPLLAATVSAALKAAGAGLAFAPSRTLLSRLLPAPGQGPGEKTRRTGFFRIQIHTRTSAGARYLARIEAQGDPGYAATSVMLGETALCLALDRDQLPGRAGVLTPATAMGAALAARLRSAGHTLTTRQISQLRRPARAPCPPSLAPRALHPRCAGVADGIQVKPRIGDVLIGSLFFRGRGPQAPHLFPVGPVGRFRRRNIPRSGKGLCRWREASPGNEPVDVRAVDLVYVGVLQWFSVQPEVLRVDRLLVHAPEDLRPQVLHPVGVEIHRAELAEGLDVDDSGDERISA